LRGRRARPPIIARVVDGRVALDLRAILPEDDVLLGESVVNALARVKG